VQELALLRGTSGLRLQWLYRYVPRAQRLWHERHLPDGLHYGHAPRNDDEASRGAAQLAM